MPKRRQTLFCLKVSLIKLQKGNESCILKKHGIYIYIYISTAMHKTPINCTTMICYSTMPVCHMYIPCNNCTERYQIPVVIHICLCQSPLFVFCIFIFQLWSFTFYLLCRLISAKLLLLTSYFKTSVCFSSVWLAKLLFYFFYRVTFCSCIWTRILFVQEKFSCLMLVLVPYFQAAIDLLFNSSWLFHFLHFGYSKFYFGFYSIICLFLVNLFWWI